MKYFHEPQIIRDITNRELENAKEAPCTFPALPLHSTSVERAVKLVTEASSQVYGMEARHNLILSINDSRRNRPAFDNKKDYKLIT